MELKSPRFDRLPQLRSLAVFEAAARLGRFAAAATELGMTQAGVSQHIAQLEAELESPLFRRGHRGVTLTPIGERFRDTVVQALSSLQEGVATAHRGKGHRTIHILTDFGFAAWWLMPRLGRLSDLVAGVDVRVATTQSEPDSTDPFDIAVLFGAGDWTGVQSRLLLPERIYPVCAPDLAPLGTAIAPQELAAMRLLHLRHTGRHRWFNWNDWFQAHDAELAPGRQDLTFNNYQLVLDAAMLGQGVALGWSPLIDDLVARGQLVRLAAEPLCSRRGYHLLAPPGGGSVAARSVADWLIAECATFEDGR